MKPLAAGSPESAANDEDRTATDLCRSFPKVRVTSVTVPRVLRLDYGVDRFFVEENTGRTVEDALRKGGVYAIWKVSGSGKIVLHGLKIGDAVVR